jgi:hypothetical protein
MLPNNAIDSDTARSPLRAPHMVRVIADVRCHIGETVSDG